MPNVQYINIFRTIFINAYIGIFIANKAIAGDFTRFWIWSMLINGLRVGVFLILLVTIAKLGVTNVQSFVLMTMLGYFAFIAAEVYGLNKHTLRMAREREK